MYLIYLSSLKSFTVLGKLLCCIKLDVVFMIINFSAFGIQHTSLLIGSKLNDYFVQSGGNKWEGNAEYSSGGNFYIFGPGILLYNIPISIDLHFKEA